MKISCSSLIAFLLVCEAGTCQPAGETRPPLATLHWSLDLATDAALTLRGHATAVTGAQGQALALDGK